MVCVTNFCVLQMKDCKSTRGLLNRLVNIEPLPTTATAPRLRAAWRNHLESMGATHALTLTINAPATADGLRAKLHQFFGRLDRAILGRRFNEAPPECRTAYVAFAENLTTNAHAHALIRVIPDRRAEVENLLGDTRSRFWSHVAPAGTHVLRPIDDEGWASYCTKFVGLNSEVFVSP